MLNFHYTCDKENPNGTILVILEETCVENPYITPLNFSIKNSISGVEIWKGTLNNLGDWTCFTFGFHSDAEVTDLLGNSILKWKWDPFLHGDQIHKFFNTWANSAPAFLQVSKSASFGLNLTLIVSKPKR